MDKLIAALKEKGLNISPKMEEGQIITIAKSMGIEPLDYMERTVEIVPYTNKKGQTNNFVKTPNFTLGVDAKGKTKTTGGLFLRVEALDQAIHDLMAARDIIKKQG